jgi:two-component system sensor histidine kinase RegB
VEAAACDRARPHVARRKTAVTPSRKTRYPSSMEIPSTHAAHRPAQASEAAWLELGVPWLVRLRWAAVLVQAVALGTARVAFDLDFPWFTVIALVALSAASNGALARRQGEPRATAAVPWVLMLDVALLTAILGLTGGPMNPFSVFYVVHVALAAMLLETRRAWLVATITIVAFACLFLMQPDDPHAMHHGEALSAHLIGMWVAYLLAAGFVAHFVSRLSSALRARERRLAEVAQLAAVNERLASLSSFSANAAHELGSPLGTIALAAGDLVTALEAVDRASPLSEDARLVAREVARCRGILADLSARAGQSVGEMPSHSTPQAVVDAAVALLPPPLRASLAVTWETPEAADAPCLLTVRTLSQMVANLLRNAWEASEDTARPPEVTLAIACREELVLRVLDRGPGLPPAVAARLGEPFVTTRADRGGLGLGLYLAAAFARRAGGSLSVSPRQGGGTEARLTLARDAVAGAF